MDFVDGWKRDLEGGVPLETVMAYARKHIAALRDLPASTPDRSEAIDATLAFLTRHTPTEQMDRDSFAELAKTILDQRGVDIGWREYSDEIVTIRAGFNGLDLEVTRNDNNNPVTMVKRGAVIRHHGEHIYLTAHLRRLAETC